MLAIRFALLEMFALLERAAPAPARGVAHVHSALGPCMHRRRSGGVRDGVRVCSASPHARATGCARDSVFWCAEPHTWQDSTFPATPIFF